jgi:hypothetical protein
MMSLIEFGQHKGERFPVKHRMPAALNVPLKGLFQFGEAPLHQFALRGPPRQGLEVGNGAARGRGTRMAVGRQLQVLHGEFDSGSVKVFGEHVSNARSLFALSSERSPISVEIGIYDAAERSYSGLRIPHPPPSLTTFSGRVAALFNGMFEYFRAPPSLSKREVVPDIEPASFTFGVANVERPISTELTDTYAQARQETVTQFHHFALARPHGIQPFRGQGLNTHRHTELSQKVPKRFQKV